MGGYPTGLFSDPDGKPIGGLTSREPADVARQIRDAVQRTNGKEAPAAAPAAPQKTVYGLTIEKAATEARKAGKPVLLVFYDDSPASTSVHAALTDDFLKDTLRGFILSITPYKKGADDAQRFDVTRAPTILVLSPDLEKKPLAKIEGSRSARELKRDLESAMLLGKGEGTPRRPGVDSSSPAPEKGETLSDDEIERKFIKARIAASLELFKRGKKDKAVEILEDVIKSYPKHDETVTARKLLEEYRK
jgi:hypothetical protein